MDNKYIGSDFDDFLKQEGIKIEDKMEIQSIHGGYEITGRYRSKNRLLGTHIRMDTVKFNVNKSYELKYFLTCEDHGDHKDDNINKTDATFWMRKPWLWCDECAALHFNQEGYIENDYLGDARSDDE